MKARCKICGLKGYFEESKVTEFWASRFLFVGKLFKKKHKSYHICRNCVRDILGSLQSEQSRIDDLYKPEIKEKKNRR